MSFNTLQEPSTPRQSPYINNRAKIHARRVRQLTKQIREYEYVEIEAMVREYTRSTYPDDPDMMHQILLYLYAYAENRHISDCGELILMDFLEESRFSEY